MEKGRLGLPLFHWRARHGRAPMGDISPKVDHLKAKRNFIRAAESGRGARSRSCAHVPIGKQRYFVVATIEWAFLLGVLAVSSG